jgi:rod shape-determining protein MreC
MVGVPSRHKSLVLLAVTVLAQILLLAVQIRSDSQGRLIRVWTVGAISPFERAGSYGIGGVRGTWGHYFALQNTSRENGQLRHENDRLKLENIQLQSRVAEAARLEALLNFRQSHQQVPMLGARVIASSADSASRTIYIDRGERDGVQRNMGVITPDGIVGKVIETFASTSQVLLLTDKDSGVGAMIAESRIQSPVGGTGEPRLDMKYVANDDKVDLGQLVVTSGMDRIFPRDLPVGTIADVRSGNPFKVIRVQPAANLERLEEVIVLTTLQPLDLKKDPATGTPIAASKLSADQTATVKASGNKPAIDTPAASKTNAVTAHP